MSESAQRTLRTILAGLPGILALKNKKLAYEVVNPAFCQFLAKGPEEIAGKTDEQLFPAAEASAAAKEHKSVVSSGIPRRVEVQFTGKEGPRWFDLALSPILDDNGDPEGVMIAGSDITAFKQREAAVAHAEGAVAEAVARADAAQEKLVQIHEEAKNLEAAAQTVQDHLKQREKQLAQALKQTSTLEAQLKEAQDAAEAATTGLSDANARLSAQAGQLDAANARATAAESAANESTAQLQALRARAAELEAAAGELAAVQARLAQAELNMQAAEQSTQAAEQRAQAAETQVAAANAAQAALSDEVKRLTQLQTEVAALARQLSEKVGG